MAAAVTILSRTGDGVDSCVGPGRAFGHGARAGRRPRRCDSGWPTRWPGRFRTSLLLGMYALVMFTLTFLAVFAGIFSSQEHDFLRDVRAGTDIVVDSNPANPVDAATLRRQPDVVDASVLLRAGPEFTDPDPAHAGPVGAHRVRRDVPAPTVSPPSRAIFRGSPTTAPPGRRCCATRRWSWWVTASSVAAADRAAHASGSATRSTPQPDDRRHRRAFIVAGLVDRDFVFNGVLASDAAVERVDGTGRSASDSRLRHRAPRRRPRNGCGAPAGPAARQRRRGTAVHRGRARADEPADRLLPAHAGLPRARPAHRHRRARRRDGACRARAATTDRHAARDGFHVSVVRRAFLFEAGFIAAQGIAVGVVLGLVTAYQVLANSSTFGDQPLPFALPIVAAGDDLCDTAGGIARPRRSSRLPRPAGSGRRPRCGSLTDNSTQ